jgi:hypothetical protein
MWPGELDSEKQKVVRSSASVLEKLSPAHSAEYSQKLLRPVEGDSL